MGVGEEIGYWDKVSYDIWESWDIGGISSWYEVIYIVNG